MSAIRRVLVAGTAVVGLSVSASYGFAQTGENTRTELSGAADDLFARDRNVAVGQRPHEGYQARGLRTGSFLVYPKVGVTVEHNDNIFSRRTPTVSDVIWRVSPELNIASDLPRHSLSAYARGAFSRYADNKSENSDDYTVGARGRLDVQRFSNITAAGEFAHLTEPRTSPDSPGVAANPVRYDRSNLSISGQHTFNRLRVTGRYTNARYNYDDAARIGGGVVDQDFRDRTIDVVTGRVDYAVSPATALFAELSGNKRNYRHRPAGDINRESDGVQGLVGANFELGAVTRGEIAVGYLDQNLDDPRLQDVKGFAARAKVEWFPTQLTTVTFNATRNIQDTSSPGTGAMLQTDVGARVDHELLRNVILTAKAGYGVDKFKTISRKDERTRAGLGVTYLLTRSVGLTGSYDYERSKPVRGAGPNFKVNTVGATLTLQY